MPTIKFTTQASVFDFNQVDPQTGLMERPKAEKPYTFVRSREGEIESTTFVRHSDGSAGFVADGFFHVHEGGPDVWQNALAELATLGFEEIGAAKARGILPVDWNPPQAKDSAI